MATDERTVNIDILLTPEESTAPDADLAAAFLPCFLGFSPAFPFPLFAHRQPCIMCKYGIYPMKRGKVLMVGCAQDTRHRNSCESS
jgi:hypothetical protein